MAAARWLATGRHRCVRAAAAPWLAQQAAWWNWPAHTQQAPHGWQQLQQPPAGSPPSACSPHHQHLHHRRGFSTVPEPDAEYLALYDEQLATPHWAQPVALRQLEQLARTPSLPLLVNSAGFLKQQLPARLENHLARLTALPRPRSAPLAELLASTVTSKRRGLEVAQDWRLVDTSSAAGLSHFESHLATFREHLEVEVSRLTAAAQNLTEQPGWWDDEQQVRLLNRTLDLCHFYLLSARVMLTQHSAALNTLEQSGGASSSSNSAQPAAAAAAGQQQQQQPVWHYHEPGHKATDPDQPYTPPHQALSEQRPLSLIRRHYPLARLVKPIIEDCRAFCVEKNSAAPDVQVVGGEELAATLVVPYVEYVLTEVLKNSLQAVIARYGSWEVDDAPPVVVELQEAAGTAAAGSDERGGAAVQLRITDYGNGIPPNQMAGMFNYFWSSNRTTSTWYGYGRNHGSQFQGQGVGVPMARVYAHFMGGSIHWETDAWKRHTTVTITLPKHGFTF